MLWQVFSDGTLGVLLDFFFLTGGEVLGREGGRTKAQKQRRTGNFRFFSDTFGGIKQFTLYLGVRAPEIANPIRIDLLFEIWTPKPMNMAIRIIKKEKITIITGIRVILFFGFSVVMVFFLRNNTSPVSRLMSSFPTTSGTFLYLLLRAALVSSLLF